MAFAPIRRFVVEGDSMLPSYANGDLVFASKSKRARVGQVRVLRHPYNPGMWLVKRVASVRGDDMTISSDNPDATRADSREFGHVPVTGSLRVIARLRARS
jgi:nickel-type superoxide dismutase maturation protease